MSARKQPVRTFRPRKSKLISALVIVAALVPSIAIGHFLWHRRGPQVPTPIFAGVTYQAEQIASSEEGGGLLHVVTVDLAAPGIELYVTPLDPEAVAQGWQYRLRRIGDVVQTEHLAVAINATVSSQSWLWPAKSNTRWWLRMSGDLARSRDTVVANHVVSHIWEHDLCAVV